MNNWLALLYFADGGKLCDAEPEQVEFLSWYRREQWRKNEERRMALLVEVTFQGMIDREQIFSREDVWKRWCYRYLCRRFHDMTRWEWIPALAKLDMEWLWHGSEDEQAFGYLKMVRDTAIQFVTENHLEGRKGVDI